MNVGTLRVHVVGDRGSFGVTTSGDRGLTVVLLHGYGAPGGDLVGPAGRVVAPVATRFLLPESPHLLDDLALFNLVDDARVWWARDARSRQEALGIDSPRARAIPEDVAPARGAIVALLDALEAEHGIASEAVVVGGFSQGAALALDVVLRTERHFAGLVLLSAGMGPSGPDLVPLMPRRRGLPVLQAHGKTDSAIPFASATTLAEAMREAGMEVTFLAREGDHGISSPELEALGTWLQARERFAG